MPDSPRAGFDREAPPDEARQAAGRLRQFIFAHTSGGCRLLSRGSDCECPLCDLDRLAAGPRIKEGDVSSDEMTRFDYALNAMENAAQAKNPAEAGYGAARKAVVGYVESLVTRMVEAEKVAYNRAVTLNQIADAAQRAAR